MPETSLRNDEQIRRNIELAYIGLTLKGELVDAASLTKEVISIGRMAADNSLAVLVQKSARLVGTIKDIKFEESSQRYLASGEMSVEEAISMKDDEIVGRLKVVDMIEAVRGFGSAKSEKLMKEIGIAKNRRLKGLGWKQAKELIDRLP